MIAATFTLGVVADGKHAQHTQRLIIYGDVAVRVFTWLKVQLIMWEIETVCAGFFSVHSLSVQDDFREPKKNYPEKILFLFLECAHHTTANEYSSSSEVTTNNLICIKALFLVGSHSINTFLGVCTVLLLSLWMFVFSANMLMSRHQRHKLTLFTEENHEKLRWTCYIYWFNWQD